MENKNELQEFDLDDILSEFHDIPEPDAANVEPDEELEELLHLPEITVTPVVVKAPEPAASEEDPAVSGDTMVFIPTQEHTAEESAISDVTTVIPGAPEDTTVIPETIEDTKVLPEAEGDTGVIPETEVPTTPKAEPAFEVEEEFTPPAILFNPRTRLKELKKKLVAGPEKRYYELTEIGVGRLQAAILLNVIIVLLCAGATTMFTLGMVPENRLRLVIFTQVLAMLVSALLGSHQMVDAMGELLKGRFTINSLVPITFAACCVDAVFCLKELRVPCCAAFSLQMTMALWARYNRRNTEIAQMDTLRKAVRLTALVKEPDYYEGRPGVLRAEGQLEDFTETYTKPSAPEVIQSVYAAISLLACAGIAVLAGMRHGLSLAIQIFSTSLLVAVPASFFLSTTRPMAVLEKRLHMVGTVLCGWKGVRGLSGRAVFPLKDSDLFPQGSTKLNGVKFYGDRDPDDVVSYSTALITAAGGGLTRVFKQLLTSRSCAEYPVTNFQNYGSGGIGGEVNGEPVLLGTLNFLQDMGVEIPEGTMVSQAVYASIDGQLSAVYAISYAKMRSAAAGMVTLSGYRKLTPIMTCGDFMLTEDFLRAKFDIKTRRIVFPTREERRALLQHKPDPETPALALTTRDELVSAAYAVTGARALRTATNLSVSIHLIGGIVGLLIMVSLAILGSTELLTPTHVLLYQLVWMVPGLLITEWTRTV